MKYKRLVIYSSIIIITLLIGLCMGEKGVISKSANKIELMYCSPKYRFKADVPEIEFLLNVKQKKNLKRQLKFYNEHGILANNYSEGDEYHKGRIAQCDDTSKVSIKIKGRYPDNFNNSRAFSLKIKQKDKSGKKIKFSLYPIKCKSMIKEWIINGVLRMEELPYYDVQIVKVKILDSEYLAYKVPDKPTFKGKELKNLMRFNNDMNFQILSDKGWFDSDNHKFLKYKFSNTIDSSSKKIFKKQFDSRSFEINELAKTIAVLKMFQDYMPGHGIMVHNAIFWLNKEDSLIRIICSDHNFIGKTSPNGVDNLIADKFYSVFMKDIEFCNKLNLYLKYYSNPNIAKNWKEILSPKLQKYIKIIQHQYPCYDYNFDDVLGNSFELEQMVKLSLDTIHNSKKSFLVNFGYTPFHYTTKDTSVLLYPKNSSLWHSSIELK